MEALKLQLKNTFKGLRLPKRFVAIVPGDALFCRPVEVPDGLPASELTDFLTLELEAHSPFPVEHLAWGALFDPVSHAALLTAVPKARLAARGIEQPEAAYHLFPAPIALWPNPPERDCLRCVLFRDSLSACAFHSGVPVPFKVLSQRLKDPAPNAAFAARQSLAAKLNLPDLPLEDGLWLLDSISVEPNDRLLLHRAFLPEPGQSSNDSIALQLPSAALWLADLRDPDFARKEARKRAASKRVWRTLTAATIAAALLLLLQLGTGVLAALDHFARQRIAELEPRVQRIENTMTLASRLAQSTNEDIRPFHLLEAINALRPDALYFREVRANAFNRLQLEGVSDGGVNAVNSFADTLAAQPWVAEVGNNAQTRNNQTTFVLDITFAALPDLPEGIFENLPNDADNADDADTAEEESTTDSPDPNA